MHSLERSPQAARIAIVTAGVSLTGGGVGAVCAMAALAIIDLAEGGATAFSIAGALGPLAAAAGFGAVMGMVGAPVLTWALLRRVPLGHALAFTALGTVVGAVTGELTVPLITYPRFLPGVIAGALAGFVAAAVALRWFARRHAAGIRAQAE